MSPENNPSTKPKRVNIIRDNIPRELIQQDQWTVWKYELKEEGKWTKVPYDAKTGKHADSTDLSTWASFDRAYQAYQGNGYDGIGFCLNKKYTGFDFDSCRDPSTGGISDPALSEITRLNSYTEVSPSDQGLKTLTRATLPKKGHHKNGMGVFDDGRYFAITGNVIEGVSKKIESRQTEVDSFIRRYYPEDFNGDGQEAAKIQVNMSSENWERAKAEISKYSRVMFHFLTPKLEDRSGHDWRLACLCVEHGITEPNLLYQIILNNPHGKAQHYSKTNEYITTLISKCLAEFKIDAERKESFPESVITGIAKEFVDLYADCIESPKAFIYAAYLTCLGSMLSTKLTLMSERKYPPRYYALLLGESAVDRKSTSLEVATVFFKEFFPGLFQLCYGASSAEGLQLRFSESPQGNLVIISDEFKALLNKCSIQNSVLLPCLNTLFEQTHYESRTKTSNIAVENAHLSLLAASTTATYQTVWTSHFIDIGLPNRLFVVPATAQRRFPVPVQIPAYRKKSIAGKIQTEIIDKMEARSEIGFDRKAKEIFDQWYIELGRQESVHTKRVDTYCLRFMPLLAINDGKTVIDEDTVQKAITLMDWQRDIREQFDPIDATNAIATMEERIRRRLAKYPHTVGELKHFIKVSRDGVWTFNNAIRNLSEGIGREIYLNPSTKKWELMR